MSTDEQLETLIDQTLSGAIATIPAHLQEIEENKDQFQVKDSKEFVFGMIIGMALGMASALIASMSGGMPKPEDQMKVQQMVYKKIPQIREQIYK